MAVINLTIPDNQVARVVTAVCARGGYSATLPDGSPNPQTQNQFAREQISEFLKSNVREYEAEQAKIANDISVTAT